MDYAKLQEDLDKALIGPNQLLSGTKVLTESSRESPEYLDRRNFPFWFHLGKQVSPHCVVEIGPKLGLPAACFLQSCKSVEMWLALALGLPINEQSRISKSNIRLRLAEDDYTVTVMGFNKEMMQGWIEQEMTHKWPIDLAMVTEDFGDDVKIYLEFLWKYLEPEGLLVCDYISSDAQGEAFREFAGVKNREPVTFKTRHGVGIIER